MTDDQHIKCLKCGVELTRDSGYTCGCEYPVKLSSTGGERMNDDLISRIEAALENPALAEQSAPSIPEISDDLIEAIESRAEQSYRRHHGSIRGQQITPADALSWHIIHATRYVLVEAMEAKPCPPPKLPPSCAACNPTAIHTLLDRLDDFEKNGAQAVRWAPSSAHWSNELRRLFGPSAREGIESLEAKFRDANSRLDKAERECERLRAELETERMRLAACGVVALANTPESASKAREMLPEYRSASLDDVERAMDEQMRLRAENMALRNQRDELRLVLDKRPDSAIDRARGAE